MQFFARLAVKHTRSKCTHRLKSKSPRVHVSLIHTARRLGTAKNCVPEAGQDCHHELSFIFLAPGHLHISKSFPAFHESLNQGLLLLTEK